MEETSATLPLGVACTTNLHSVPALSEINSAMPPFDEFSTPKKRQCFSLDGSLYKPLCDDALKPTVGMTFDDIAVVETFYKKYAHHVGFGVRLGAQRLVNNVIQWKRFLCSREGYRSTKGTYVVNCLNTNTSSKRRKVKLTRCGCDAHIYVNRDDNGKYKIASMVEHHNHELVSPSKQHLIRSNRKVSEKVKSTLFDCHKASIGPAQAYRLLQVGEGGFPDVGCMKKDVQNYYSRFKNKIKNCDAQMLVDQFGRLKELNPGFFFDYEVDEVGTLLRLFWADATSRKNYKHFHDVLSFDSTYSTNQYDYIFAPFTGINHHMQSVFLGGGFLLNETTEDYLWLFDIFLKCMDGVAPSVIITDECGSMRNAIKALLPHTTHRLCMWHIMKKVPEKVSLELRSDELFYKRLDSCVWNSETPTEFEESWKSLISDFGLQENEWFAKCYLIRGSWVPAYFMDIALAGILRTTSRSESENSFFKNFIRRKLAFVEFWLRFDTALKCQRQEELIADHTSVHTTPRLQTCWEVERQGSILFTHEVFALFQSEVLAAREHCDVQDTMTVGELKIVSISDQSHRKNKVRDVHLETTTMIAKCSCKLFESKGIVCRHVIRVLRGAKINELPTFYVLKRWEKMCKRDIVFDNEGNALEDNPIDCIDMDTRRKISMARNKLEDIIRCAKKSSVALDSLNMGLCNLESVVLQSASVVPQTTQEEQESYVGSTMPVQVDILTPTAVNARGTCSRIKGHRDNEKKAGSNKKKLGVTLRVPRTCRTCKEVVLHDSRICPKKK
ncbi:protein FAR1-RELATED SEQUENCE 5 isoform X2 [Triticum aestivum]|uniref:protein FAR1-RELATED SEQUENCE 5 isoform X2 n=1 Tax=Triticum aestivum TaxID=4565 RepID=UPI001D0334D0|nr:protein FAR1-RELATED SEQUENCE 5-like isoform X2 [Triticum aestivum]